MEELKLSNQIMKTGEPYIFKSGKIGCVVVHGFTATPKEVRYLAEHLHKDGFTVIGVRLAGHATTPKDMERTKYEDWLASVEDGYHLLKDMCEKIFIIGLSMGGALSLTFSSTHDVNGVVVMATPYRLQNSPFIERLRIPLFEIISHFKHYQFKKPPKWYKPERLKYRISYKVNPLISVAELLRLLRVSRVHIPKIKIPTLVIHSIDDDYVVPENAELIFDALTMQDKELFYTEESSHIITEDGNREIVFKKVSEFITRVSKK